MIVNQTAVGGALLAVLTIAILLGALIAAEVSPRGRARKPLAISGVISALLCLALIVVRFVAVL
jgi:hypothetical protein